MSDATRSGGPITADENRTTLVKAFARTYGGERDPWERVEEYQRVLEYTADHPNRGSQAVATALELPRNRIRSWVDSDGRPDPVRGIQAAESHGWFDLTWDAPTFRGLNVLVAWIFSGGSIAEQNFVPSFTVAEEADRDRLTAAFDCVGLETTVYRESTASRATEFRPAEDAPALGRLLAVLGAPVSHKNTDRELSLPAYLADAPDAVRLDFARTYLCNRQTAREDRPQTPIQVREERCDAYRHQLMAFLGDVVGESDAIRGGDEGHAFVLTQHAAEILCKPPMVGDVAAESTDPS